MVAKAKVRVAESQREYVAETEKNWTLSFELPGLNEKDIQVQLMGDQLVVSGDLRTSALPAKPEPSAITPLRST